MTEDVEVAADDDRLRARDPRLVLEELSDGAELRRLCFALLGVPAELRVGADHVVARAPLVDARIDEALGGVAIGFDAIGVDPFACGTDRMLAGNQDAAVLAEPSVALAATRRVLGERLFVDRALLAA